MSLPSSRLFFIRPSSQPRLILLPSRFTVLLLASCPLACLPFFLPWDRTCLCCITIIFTALEGFPVVSHHVMPGISLLLLSIGQERRQRNRHEEMPATSSCCCFRFAIELFPHAITEKHRSFGSFYGAAVRAWYYMVIFARCCTRRERCASSRLQILDGVL